MSDDLKEVQYYPDICSKIIKYFADILQDESRVAFSINKLLPDMIAEIESKLGGKTDFYGDYVPSLQLDILIGVKNNGRVELCLVEVKRGKNLSLMHYSQLVGYLQVAKKISTGILWLVTPNYSSNPVSNDFNDIISMQKLSASWQMHCNSSLDSQSFRTGICAYTVNNGIDWVPLDACGGVSSWSSLVNEILNKKS